MKDPKTGCRFLSTHCSGSRLVVFLLSVMCFLTEGVLCPVYAFDTSPQQEVTNTPHGASSFTIDFSPEERAWIAEHPEITVSNEFDWPPFDFVVSNTPQGFGIDLMNLLSERSGVTMRYVNGYTWDELVSMFWEGKIDVLHSLSITPEREKNAHLSPPYYHSKNVLVLRRDTPDTNELRDLEGKIIALPKGWSSIQFFKKHYPGVHIIEVESSRQALEYVDQGKVFATVEQEGIAAYFIRKFGFHDLKLSKWVENEELQKTSSMHFAVLRDRTILFDILVKAFGTIQPEDMIRLENKWFSREGRQIGIGDVGLTPDEREFLAEKKTISFCVSPDRMPLEAYQHEQLTGMTVDFLEIFSERLGVSFAMSPTNSWTESLAKIKAGECEILPMVNETPERKEYLDFTSAYLNYNVVIVTREKDGFIGGLEDFSGKRVGVPESSFAWDVVRLKYPEVLFVPLEDLEQGVLQLSSGELDAILLSLPVATYHIRHMGLTNLKVAGYSGLQDTIRIGVAKSDTPLHSIMSKLVRAIPEKQVDSIYQKWITATFENRIDYSLLRKIVAVIAVILMIGIIWIGQLMRLNKRIAQAHNDLAIKSIELERMSVTDPLTGLCNRRYIDNRLDAEIVRHVRYEHQLSVILIDLDHFKQVNDVFGHQEGDLVLTKFAEILTKCIRNSDVAGRWGGEEFLVISPENDEKGAAVQAENIRKELAAVPFELSGQQTASFGIAVLRPGEDSDDLIRRADAAMYAAKEKGRNRVEIACR